MGMLISPYEFGTSGAAAPYGLWDTWELQIDANNGGATRTTLASLRFYDGNGTLIPTTGGTPYSAGSGSDEAGGDNSKAFDGNDATTFSRSSPTNVRIGYQFATAVGVASIEIVSGSGGDVAPKTCRLRYGTGGSGASFTTAFEIWEPSWTPAQSTRAWPQDTSGGKYKAHRIYITADNGDRFCRIYEIEMRATVGGSDQCANGATFATNSAVYNVATSAFDNNTSTTYDIDTAVTAFPQAVGYAFAVPVFVAQYTLTQSDSNARAAKDFKLQGTNDGVTWTDLNSQTNQTWTPPETKSYTV